ncbi:MAG: Crp/Fnr family transcriptional regulator [bacterium]
MSDKDDKAKLPKSPRELPISDRLAIIRTLEFGPALADAVLATLAEHARVVEIRRRRFRDRAADEADALFAIIKGRIKLCRIEPHTDREAIIDILSDGALFGESALYSSAGRRENSAIAYESCTLLKMPVEHFKLAMAEDQGLRDYAFRLIGQRLEHAERRLADFALNAIPARVDRLLADFSDRYGVRESDGVLIDFPLPHREIASIVGSTRESVTVRLNAMRREGTIEFVNRRILIKRPEWLLREARLVN